MPQENAIYIMLRGWGIGGISLELGILALFAILMLALSIALMRRRAYTS